MPTYEYVCRTCGRRLEIWQSFTDDPLTICDECGGELRKIFTAPAISFKGSGFYATDHGKKAKPAEKGSTTSEKESGSSERESRSSERESRSSEGGSGSSEGGSGSSEGGSGSSEDGSGPSEDGSGSSEGAKRAPKAGASETAGGTKKEAS